MVIADSNNTKIANMTTICHFFVILKVTNEEEASACFMKKVKGSHFIVSDKVSIFQDMTFKLSQS